MAKASDTDWQTVRAGYNAEYAETGTCDMQRLASRFKVKYGTLRNRSSAEKWSEEGQRLHREVKLQTSAAAIPMIVKHRVDVMEKHLTFLGQVRQLALNQLGKAAKEEKLSVKEAMSLVFNSLRAEKMLHEMVSDGPTRDMTEDDLKQAMFDRFVEKMMADETPAGAAPEITAVAATH